MLNLIALGVFAVAAIVLYLVASAWLDREERK